MEYNLFKFLITFVKQNFEAMTLIIDSSNSNEIDKILTEKFKKTPVKGNLSKHFGKLKRNIDGLEYQKNIREVEH